MNVYMTKHTKVLRILKIDLPGYHICTSLTEAIVCTRGGQTKHTKVLRILKIDLPGYHICYCCTSLTEAIVCMRGGQTTK